MRRFVSFTAVILLVVLLAPAPARAKLPGQICGADDCVPVTHARSGPLHSTGGRRAAPEVAPFYLVRFLSSDDPDAPVAWSYVFVPASEAMRGNSFGEGAVRWMDGSYVAPLVRELVGGRQHGLRPYPAPERWSGGSCSPDPWRWP